MARCTMKMPEEFLLKISRLGDKTDEVCEGYSMPVLRLFLKR